MAVKYNIKTLADAVNAVTKDNIDLFLSDFSECIRMGLELKEAYKQKTGKYPPHATLDEMIWSDDGIPGLTGIGIKLETKEKQSIGNKTAMALMKKRLFDTKIQTKPITLAEIDKLIALEKRQIIAAFGAGDLGLIDAETYYKLYE